MSKLSYSIYLIKDRYANDLDCIREGEIASLESKAFAIEGASFATLFLKKSKAKKPEWSQLFPGVEWAKYRTNSFSGLFLIDVKHKRFALTAGNGRYLLQPFAIEEGFGFKTVLNSVDPETIRKIEKKTINQNPLSSIEQLARTSGIGDFKVDYYTDIVSKVRAKSAISDLGTVVDGKDSLHLSLEWDLGDLPDVLEVCLENYLSKRYLQNFPNIDNIAELHDKEVSRALDNILVNRLNEKNFDNTWASMPEIVTDEGFESFQYSRRPNARQFHDIELDGCLNKYFAQKKRFTKEQLETSDVYVRFQNGDVYPKWHIWKCIYSEIENDGTLYILIDGKWYRVSQDFISTLEETIRSISVENFDLPNWKQHDSEGKYLQMVGEPFKLLDKDLIRVRGQSPIEFCDLYHPDNNFIHVKRYGSSDVLSYLFNQGRVSAQLFLRDSNFREKAAEKFGENAPFAIDERPNPSDYSISFVIGSRFGTDQTLPLFARVVLVATYQDLTDFGYNVTLGFVQIDLA